MGECWVSDNEFLIIDQGLCLLYKLESCDDFSCEPVIKLVETLSSAIPVALKGKIKTDVIRED